MTAQMDRAPGWRPADTFAHRLMLVRDEMGWTVEQAAQATGLRPATWSTWERGARPRDLGTVVLRIAAVTNCNRDWLMWGDGEGIEPAVTRG